MFNLANLIEAAQREGASDLHLEPGLPAAIRVRGALRTVGEPVPSRALAEAARQLLDDARWRSFLEKKSFDLSKTISGTRCRINMMQTSRGVGFAIRLLASFQATLDRLNLHPDLKKLVTHQNGLILVSGPTGSGKSSTLAALIQEVNLTESRHIITVESPIEYFFRPRKAYIRQREVGRDTPGFEQALLDALREDPDVLMVGEMREPETMRLTLNASETGHLVLATVHSSTAAEALQRVVSAFPSESQSAVAAALADCLVAVIAQRLRFRPELNIRVPECEILMATHAVKNFVRNRDFFKIASAIETGADHGMWSFHRYKNWLDSRKKWTLPEESAEAPDDAIDRDVTELPSVKSTETPPRQSSFLPPGKTSAETPASAPTGRRIEIEPEDTEFGKILRPNKPSP